ncbi:MAG TPA: diaminopimelate epimerase [Alphaproteobacteria bacterium]|nr:diaminopimelate epimerase [Alphaproteobacteria bacterium]
MIQAVKLTKMNGLGNDFLIYDELTSQKELTFSRELIVSLCSRENKKTNGCDQFIIIKKPKTNEDGFMEIFNSDGSEVYACGNATRCVGLILADYLKKSEVIIKTKADLLKAKKINAKEIEVNMGTPKFSWEKIPLSKNLDTIQLPIELEGFGVMPSAVSMGNPHMVFFLQDDVSNINIEKLGAPLEVHELFPEKANVNFANIIDRKHIKLRTFERGAGVTLACGTGACATAVSAIRKNLTERNVTVEMPGGILNINWDKSTDNVLMTGAVEYEKTIELFRYN